MAFRVVRKCRTSINVISENLLQNAIYSVYFWVRCYNAEFKKKTIRRSLLYVPGHDVKKVKKLSKINVDCAVLDCEDGVGVDW